MLLVNRINSNNSTSLNQNNKDKSIHNNGHFRKNSLASTVASSPSGNNINVTADAAASATPSSVPSSSLPLLGRSPSFKRITMNLQQQTKSLNSVYKVCSEKK